MSMLVLSVSKYRREEKCKEVENKRKSRNHSHVNTSVTSQKRHVTQPRRHKSVFTIRDIVRIRVTCEAI